MPEQPPILDHARWRALAARLDALASIRPDLAISCSAIRAPVETIERMWRDALPALAGATLAAERLAAMTVAAIPVAALVRLSREAMTVGTRAKLSETHEPGLLRIGELGMLGVAAARVAPPGLVAMYPTAIHGLALHAAPAE